MRTREDAIRSTRRYIASALGSPPWRVRMDMDGRFKRPTALVQLPNPAGWTPGGVDTVRGTAAITVQLFPEIGTTSSESKILAERAADLLSDALLLGVPDAHDPTVVGHRELIPLWDYTDTEGNPLPLDEGPQSIATKRTPRDFLIVAPGWTFQTIAEAPDDQLYTTIGELRVQWFRNARLISDGPVLKEVFVDPVPDVTITV
jgi:hypothetical protein